MKPGFLSSKIPSLALVLLLVSPAGRAATGGPAHLPRSADLAPSWPRAVLRIEAESVGGGIEAPMRIVPAPNNLGAGYIESGRSSVPPAKGAGAARYVFEIRPEDAGAYRMRARAMCIADDDDSFFFQIDGEPKKHVWDMRRARAGREYQYLSTHWIEQDVTSRTSDLPNKYDHRPHVFHLAAGKHSITFLGREYALPLPGQVLAEPYYTPKLDYFELVRIEDPERRALPVFGSRDLNALQSVGEVQLSPDGSRVAYSMAGRFWIMDLATRQSSAFGAPEDRVSSFRWSPDGRRVAYFGSVDKVAGVVLANADGGGRKLIAPVTGTNQPLPAVGERLAWSPDGHRIAFVSATPGPGPDPTDSDPVVITSYLYKPKAYSEARRFADNRRLHLFVAELGAGSVRQLTCGDYHEHSIAWSPQSDEIAFVSNREKDPDRVHNNDLFIVRLSDGAVRGLIRSRGLEEDPVWSPDGRTIAYVGTKRSLTSSETTMEDTHIWLIDRDGHNRRELGAVIDNRQGAPRWSADGRRVFFTLATRGTVALQALPIDGGPPELLAGGRTTGGSVASWSSARGEVVAYVERLPTGQADLFVRRATGARPAERLTRVNDDLLAKRRLAEVESFTFTSADGTEIEAFLTRPLDLSRTGKHPMIVSVHGGPHSQQGPGFNLTSQVYAAHGWATLMVNFRGSSGYGQKLADAIMGDQNGAEAKDVLAGVDVALRRYEWLDRDRLGIEGRSYGGQLTNWINTRTDRFKAAIPIGGISNLISFNYLAYYHDYLAVEFGGVYPHQDGMMDRLWERSPIRYVSRIKTPTMFVHGEGDNDVPVSEDEQMFIALKDVGVETVMVRYQRAGHGISAPKHRVDLIDRSVAWYERHFAAKPLPAATR